MFLHLSASLRRARSSRAHLDIFGGAINFHWPKNKSNHLILQFELYAFTTPLLYSHPQTRAHTHSSQNLERRFASEERGSPYR